jgi:excinuclease ABC subunit B
MMEHARNLEFEKAAQARDRLNALKELLFGRGRTALTDTEGAAD